MTYNEVAEKFMGCAEFAKWPLNKSKKIISTIKNLDKVKNIKVLSKLLSK
jgi:hypothetical protein